MCHFKSQAALLVITKILKQTKYSSPVKCIKHLGHIHAVEYCIAMKINKLNYMQQYK